MSDEAHILVVDDDDRIRDLLKRFLVKEGYRVTTAPHAASARKFMSMIDFDLSILDIMMPTRRIVPSRSCHFASLHERCTARRS